MPRALILALTLGGAALALVLWAGGSLDALSRWALAMQVRVQDQMALALRALHAGDPGALAGLWGLCLTYGVAHAVGPGHGKVVLGAYGAARQVSAGRIAAIVFAASLAQGLAAIG